MKKNNKLMCGLLFLTATTFTTLSTNAYSKDLSLDDLDTTNTSLNSSLSTYYSNTTYDAAVPNEDKIIDMLKREGKIPEGASDEEAHEYYISYMQGIAAKDETKDVTMEEKELNFNALENQIDGIFNLFNSDNSKIKMYADTDDTAATDTTSLNVLALMVQYSDYSHNSITEDESDMYYDDYNTQHYQDMLFGDNGYTGPNGETFTSFKQYYQEQSNGTLEINGTVTSWYTAPNTAAYYGASTEDDNDSNPRTLIMDALAELAKDPSIDLSQFDKIDRYDLDGDGNYDEPDGMIDYLLVIHAGTGEEAGGGSLGSDAIWSHRWNLGGLYAIPGTEYVTEDGTTRPYYAYDYIINPEDGAAGVFCHEFGHDLGLPDEYDTAYSSNTNEPISAWSLMSYGSWTGTVPGTEPSGISPYSRAILQDLYGGGFQNQTVIDYEDLTRQGTSVNLTAASQSGQVLKVNLPDVSYSITTPTSGSYAYWSGKGTDGTPTKNSMSTTIDLTNTTNPSLNFKAWYDIEEGWDFATVQVREAGTDEWTVLPGNITTTDHNSQAEVLVGDGITGTSEGWVDGIFDLSQFAGKNIELKFEYETDSYTFGQGLYIDDISVVDNSNAIFSDDAESDDAFALEGFTKDTGSESATNYYLIEWRDHSGVDTGLGHVHLRGTDVSYDSGMVVWYVNEFYTENYGGVHPGGGFLSIVDADQDNVTSKSNGTTYYTTNHYQMHDAAFSTRLSSKIKYTNNSMTYTDLHRTINRTFKDTDDYTNSELPALGTQLQKLGINVKITKQARDDSSATLNISKK